MGSKGLRCFTKRGGLSKVAIGPERSEIATIAHLHVHFGFPCEIAKTTCVAASAEELKNQSQSSFRNQARDGDWTVIPPQLHH